MFSYACLILLSKINYTCHVSTCHFRVDYTCHTFTCQHMINTYHFSHVILGWIHAVFHMLSQDRCMPFFTCHLRMDTCHFSRHLRMDTCHFSRHLRIDYTCYFYMLKSLSYFTCTCILFFLKPNVKYFKFFFKW